MFEKERRMRLLSAAQKYANENSTCAKVQTASLIITQSGLRRYGCNHGIERDCIEAGCHRIEKYGENSKVHRLPSDCVAVHSEIDAICAAAREGIYLKGATIFVTRYPCETCARAIIESGIKKVIYGRSEPISDMTKQMFETAHVTVIHESDWKYADDNS